jgi:DNA-binding FrmR family transcriptional regulator
MPTTSARHRHEDPTSHGTVHEQDARSAEILRRLRSVEGHVRGIERMVEEDAYCMDVVNQVLAVQRALKKVSALVLDRHLHTCATSAIRGEDVAERERILGEILDLFEATGKV